MKRKHSSEDITLNPEDLQHKRALQFLIFQMGKENYQKMIDSEELPEDYERYFKPIEKIKKYNINHDTLRSSLLHHIKRQKKKIKYISEIPENITTVTYGFFSYYKKIRYPFNITEINNTNLSRFLYSENYNRCFKLLYDQHNVFKDIENDINNRLNTESKTIEIIPELSKGVELKEYITIISGYRKINIPIKSINPNNIFDWAFEKAEKKRILKAIDNNTPYVIMHIGYDTDGDAHANSVIIDKRKKRIIYLESQSENEFEVLPIHAFNLWCQSSDNLNDPKRNYTFIAYAVGVQDDDLLCYLWSYLLPLMYVLNPDINIFDLYDELIKGTTLKYTIIHAFLFYICSKINIKSNTDSKLDHELNDIVKSIRNDDELNKLFVDILKGKYDKQKKIDLSRTSIQDLSPLSSLTQLQELDLSRTKFQDLSPLSSLTQLQELDLSRTKIQNLSTLSSLKQLKKLNLSYCRNIDLYPLSSLTQLKKLNLSYNKTLDLSPLSSLKELKELNLSFCTNIKDLSPLSTLTKLQELNLSYCRNIDLSPLSTLTKLQELNLSETEIKDFSPLSSLTQLQELDLSHTKIEDLSPLSSLTQLQYLNLSETKIKDLSPLSSLTQLQELNLFACKNIEDLSPLKKLNQLQELVLKNCINITEQQIINLQNILLNIKIYY